MRVITAVAALVIAASLAAFADSSPGGTMIDLSFTGKVIADPSHSAQSAIADQLRFLIGQMNGYGAGVNPNRAVVSDIVTKKINNRSQVTYSASVPAIWNKRTRLSTTVELNFPLDLSATELARFVNKYAGTCVDAGAHDVDAGSLFFYFRPQRPGCNIAASDMHRVQGVVSRPASSTAAKFPEYDKVWADGTLNVVAIFEKYEPGANASSDAGIAAYDAFIASMKDDIGRRKHTTTPSSVPTRPGTSLPDVEFNAALPDGKRINVVALLVDDIGTAFSRGRLRLRYESLAAGADLIVCNGRTGAFGGFTGAGRWTRGQYAVVFLNGPDSWSFDDAMLRTAHARVNSDDPKGFKYLDVVTNGMPAFFASMPAATMAIYRGLSAVDNPQTYDQILASIDPAQLALVTGDHDNGFTHSTAGGGASWEGLNASGKVAKNETRQWITPQLTAGTYVFSTSGSGGDVDLYVRIGRAPTTSSYDCRPAKTGSVESCEVHIAQPAAIYVMVRGYAPSSDFTVVGRKAN